MGECMTWAQAIGGLVILLATGGVVIIIAELLCGMLDLPRVRASHDEYDEVQS